MVNSEDKNIKIDDWYFEIKVARAVKVDNYGDPYSCIANCTINGDCMYIDGLLTKTDEDFTKKDFMTFYRFCEKLGLKKFTYDRFVAGERVTKEVVIGSLNSSLEEVESDNRLRVVK